MANRIFRIILGIVLVIGAVVGIYFVLPGSIKHPLQEKLQSFLKSDQFEAITYLKGITVPNSDMNFGDMIENAGKHGSWIIEDSDVGEDGKSGPYEIHAYVYDVDLSLAQENGQDNRKNMSQAAVDICFNLRRTVGSDPEYVVSSYAIWVDEALQNDFYKKEVLGSLVAHARTNKSNAELLEGATTAE